MSLVSVIIPAYNYGRFLEECVESVRAQTYPHWEIAICDDGSTDETPQVAEALARRDPERIRYYRLANGGVSAARNYGIAATTGEFILPLDADDALFPDSLERFVDALRRDPEAGYAFGNLENYEVLPGDLRVWLQGPFSRKGILVENSAACTSMWRRSLWDRGVRYRPVLIEDWDLWLQITALGYRGAYIPELMFRYRMHISGRTARNRFLYLPALFELMGNNPSLYEPAAVEWARSCLAHSPACWNKESFILIPEGAGAEIPDRDTIALCSELSRRGHYAAVLGKYPPGLTQIPGVAFLGLPDTNDVDALAHKIGANGAQAIVVSAKSGFINRRLQSLKNVAVVAPWDVTALSEPGKFVDRMLALCKEHYGPKKNAEDAFWSTQKALHDSATLPAQSAESPVLDCLAVIASRSHRQELAAVTEMSARPHVIAAVIGESQPAASRSEVFMRAVGKAPSTSWLCFLPEGATLREDWAAVVSRYLQAFGPKTVFLMEARYLPPLSRDSFSWEYAALAARARFRDFNRRDALLVHRETFAMFGGLNRHLLGDGPEFEEFGWRAECAGCRIVWLPSNLLVRHWTLSDLTYAEAAYNEEILRVVKRAATMEEPDYQKVRAFLPAERRPQDHPPFAPLRELERQLRTQPFSDSERVTALLAWGSHCLAHNEDLSARDAFEDVLALDPRNVSALTGLAQCVAARGPLNLAAHYTSAALAVDPEFQGAKELRHILEAAGVQ